MVHLLRGPEGLGWHGCWGQHVVLLRGVQGEGAHMRYCPECGAPTTLWDPEGPMYCRSCGWDETYEKYYYSLLRGLRRSRLARADLLAMPPMRVT